jgi:hypothetical protein
MTIVNRGGTKHRSNASTASDAASSAAPPPASAASITAGRYIMPMSPSASSGYAINPTAVVTATAATALA